MKKKSLVLLLPLIFILLITVIYAQSPIQTQPSSDGTIEASLIGADVRRGVLTVKISLKNISNRTVEPELRFKDLYYTDIKEKKKYYGLKDSQGNYIAGPASYGWAGGTFKEKILPNERKIIWIKFPSPPESSNIIDIFVPDMLPFEEIGIKR